MSRIKKGVGVEALVSRQLELWRVRQSLLAQEQPPKTEAVRFGPYVAISRDFGSGGAEIARQVAAQLGWELFDREIIQAMADHAHLRKEVFESLDERGRSKIEDWIRGLIEQSHWLGQDIFRRYLVEVLNTIALHGYAVLIGRGAHLVLPPEAGLRVKITAPLADRIRRVQARENLSPEHAQRRVKEEDEKRNLFLRNIVGHYSEVFTDYDMVFNTSGLSAQAVVGLIVQGVLEKTGSRS